jgi:hypothetical protein
MHRRLALGVAVSPAAPVRLRYNMQQNLLLGLPGNAE